ncbi:MAG: patatin-like phospholipase family protein [Wenzhouxiangella sp.]
MSRPALFCGLFAVLFVTGCAHYPLNEPADTFDAEAGYRFDALEASSANSDSLFICLAFSGGGTRAAALAFGVLQALDEARVTIDGEPRSLLDEVDCISSVSGGSFTAAYYGLYRQRLFEDFRQEFLDRDIQGALARRLFNPVNLFRVASPHYGRIDLAADYYHRHIFDEATYADLQRTGRPFVIVNATNLGPGRRFAFDQTHFDALGSRLANFPVARAVAASSAFPYLLSPISLVNHPTASDYQPPWWYRNARSPDQRHTRRGDAAANLSVYLDDRNTHVHLMDGGLSDNIGARAILDAWDRGFIRTRINDGEIERLVVIVVNARTESEDTISRKARPPGLFTVAGKTATVAMDNYSFESVERLRNVLYERVQTQRDLAACTELVTEHCPEATAPLPFPVDVDPYVIEVNFEDADRLPGEDPRYYLDLPTTFKLDADQIDRLIAIGPKLLEASGPYQCLLEVIEAEAEGRERPQECPVGAGIRGRAD